MPLWHHAFNPRLECSAGKPQEITLLVFIDLKLLSMTPGKVYSSANNHYDYIYMHRVNWRGIHKPKVVTRSLPIKEKTFHHYRKMLYCASISHNCSPSKGLQTSTGSTCGFHAQTSSMNPTPIRRPCVQIIINETSSLHRICRGWELLETLKGCALTTAQSKIQVLRILN